MNLSQPVELINKSFIKKFIMFVLFVCSSFLFQSFPVYFHTIGLFISPFSTLPISLASYYSFNFGFLSYISTLILLFLISPEEAIIFTLTTGLFGLSIGRYINKNTNKGIVFSTITLFIGINILITVIGIETFGVFTHLLPIPLMLIIIILFSGIYSILWFYIAKYIANKLDNFIHFNK